MESELCLPGSDPSLVGDPVDSLSGSVVDRMLDFRLTGPIELRWYRHYDSSQHQRAFSLGWGYAHEYDRTLRLQDAELVYEEPVGRSVIFPRPATDGDECARGGLTLRRLSPSRYVLRRHAQPAMEFEFPPQHPQARLVRLFDARHQVCFEYHETLGLSRIVDSAGRRLAIQGGADGRVRRVTLEDGPQGAGTLLVEYDYDARGNLVATRNAAGHGYAFAYDDANRMLRRRGRKGFQFKFAYDAQGRCVLASGDQRMYGVALDYKVAGRMTRVTRPDRGVWAYAFASGGHLTEIRDPLGGVQKFVRDEAHRVALELDASGNGTRVIHDAAGAPIARVDPLGRARALPDSGNGPSPEAHPVAASAAEYEYGRLLDPAACGLPEAGDAALDALPPTVRPMVVTRPAGVPRATGASFPVGPLGALWWPEPQHGRVFNDFGKLTAQRDDWGRTRAWTYDASGNIAAHLDFDGGTWTHDYGSWHLLLGLQDPAGATTRWTYTTSGHVASCTDPGGSVSEYRYDLADRLIEIRRHGAVRDTYVRDAAGNLLAKLGRDGRELLRIERGPAGLPVRRVLASGDEHTLSHDKAGRCTAAATSRDKLEFKYTAAGRRTHDQRNGKGVVQQFQGPGRLARSVLLDRFVVHYRWDGNDRLVITDPGRKQQVLRLLGKGLTERRFSNGTVEYAQHDRQGRCLFKSRQGTQGVAWTRQYHWSGEGELRRVQDSVDGEVRHEYDAAHRLSRRVTRAGVESFEMDRAGNLLAQPGLEATRMLTGNRLGAANGSLFTYNDRDHVDTRERAGDRIRYHYDSRDQLVRVESAGLTWTADYDALGRRTRKAWAGQAVEYYWASDQLVAEVHASGPLRLYIHADPLAMTPLMFLDYESPEADPASGRRGFIFSDQIGTPCRIEDENGLESWRARIQPFGSAELADPGDLGFHLRFPGHYHDPELGLHYNRFRYYDPSLGRYLQSDPWGIAGGANLYAYRPNPLLKVDVRGLGEEESAPSTPRQDDEEGTTPPRRADEPPPEPSAFPNLQRGGGNADMHADRAVAAVQNSRPPMKQNRSVTVIEHADGTVSVGLSGNDPRRAEHAQRVVDDLNRAHPADPPTYRTSGPVDATNLNDPGSPANPSPMPGTCSEPQAAQAAGTNTSPPENYQTVWTGPGECPPAHQRPGRPQTAGGNETMQPCPTCQSNADNYGATSTQGSQPPAPEGTT